MKLYTKSGKLYTGKKHRMPNGQYHTGAKHTSKSQKLYKKKPRKK